MLVSTSEYNEKVECFYDEWLRHIPEEKWALYAKEVMALCDATLCWSIMKAIELVVIEFPDNPQIEEIVSLLNDSVI